MKMAVCRLCGVPHRLSDPHVFDMKAASTIEGDQQVGPVRKPFGRGAPKVAQTAQPKADRVQLTAPLSNGQADIRIAELERRLSEVEAKLERLAELETRADAQRAYQRDYKRKVRST